MWDLWRHRNTPPRPWSDTELRPLEAALRELAILDTTSSADEAVAHAYSELHSRTLASGVSFPHVYDPDRNLVRLVHAAVISRAANVVIEVGVGNGICTSVILQSLGERGRLISVDLPPPISDPTGLGAGKAVADHLRGSWVLRRGSSRRLLPQIVKELGSIDLFLSDGANLTAIQVAELEAIWPHLNTTSGIAIFNNVSREFVAAARTFTGSIVILITQPDKLGCATACLSR
jgi:predicted O-methyltransferase YrrM